jgi:hypothetical protein
VSVESGRPKQADMTAGDSLLSIAHLDIAALIEIFPRRR